MLLLVGCSQLKSQFVTPEARVAGFELVEMGLFSGRAEIALIVDNPNAFSLVANGLRYKVWLGEYPIADTRSDEKIDIPASDQALVKIPLEFSYQGLYSAVQSMLQTGEIAYRVEGAVFTPLIELPFSRSGQFMMPKGESGRSSPSI
jgi:hypothetical protein